MLDSDSPLDLKVWLGCTNLVHDSVDLNVIKLRLLSSLLLLSQVEGVPDLLSYGLLSFTAPDKHLLLRVHGRLYIPLKLLTVIAQQLMQFLYLQEPQNLPDVVQHIRAHVPHLLSLSDAPLDWHKVLLIVVGGQHSILHSQEVVFQLLSALRNCFKQEDFLLEQCLSALFQVVLAHLEYLILLLS